MRWRVPAEVVIGAVASAAGAVAIAVTGPHTTSFGDAKDYMDTARTLLDDHSYLREGSVGIFRTPGFPVLIALTWLVRDGSIVAVKIANALCFAGTAMVLYRIARDAGLSRAAGLVGGLAFAVYPIALVQVTEVQSEPLHTFLIAVCVLLGQRAIAHQSLRYAAAAGLVFGAATLTRPSALALAAGFAVTFAWLFRGGVRRRLAAAGLVVLGVAVFVVPWAILNQRATGDLILLNDEGGLTFWVGNQPEAIRLLTGDVADRAEFDRLAYDVLFVEKPGKLIAEWRETKNWDDLSPGRRDAVWREQAIDEMVDHPGRTARQGAIKAWAFWRPWLLPEAYGTAAAVGTGVVLSALYVFGVLGGRSLRRTPEGRTLVTLLLVMFAAAWVTHTIIHISARFRVPYVDPYLVLLSAAAVVGLVARRRSPDREAVAEA